ncbi:hypothetical protein [Lacticaseibacillus sharpeae]|uniref:Uncharacterized protein n=1 Tax=Lacticaseibacillus sharpeae JCM 1186 = DSM 20505 TaxID=1291052 RepID=A0A0R1ZNS3_9LACO|nr:hypothetical protein [Lacticaseibacillus sharpeae]KRM56637.1 hypothetical protein FC18_GL001767 [Lacticaseibacillus sharpeae JCM 1186 = DSM 20505]
MIDNGYDLPGGFDGDQKRTASTFATGWYEKDGEQRYVFGADEDQVKYQTREQYELEGWSVHVLGSTDWFEQSEYLGLEIEGITTGHTFEISDEPLPSAAELIKEQEARDREEHQ